MIETGLVRKPTEKHPTAFQATQLTPTTFLIKEYDDIYSEHPFIYVKIVAQANLVVVIDTGCGGASSNSNIHDIGLREFIEMVDIDVNDGKPLNREGKMNYTVVITHCHYDHILGVEQFSDSTILASSRDFPFLLPSALPDSSLCKGMGIHTPSYISTLVPHLYSIPECAVLILHTPGHTPDEVAIYDSAEKMLYVGDSVYEDEDIIISNQGSITEWLASITVLISLVNAENQKQDSGVIREVLINAGHCTAGKPALEVLKAGKAFMLDVINRKEPIRKRAVIWGEENVYYRQERGRFSLRCPARLVLGTA
ncbi:beta-lactamase-like protein [Collybia nuda]|uniref:Beta-lactamase-like protein n=1 Tax=Collybia nuda TaxID=64659 RepID=A0A9P5YGD3_9AGAR|nr:beta-lactamase-like protein [Collybia nuda]